MEEKYLLKSMPTRPREQPHGENWTKEIHMPSIVHWFIYNHTCTYTYGHLKDHLLRSSPKKKPTPSPPSPWKQAATRKATQERTNDH